jgi:hypothetical protein
LLCRHRLGIVVVVVVIGIGIGDGGGGDVVVGMVNVERTAKKQPSIHQFYPNQPLHQQSLTSHARPLDMREAQMSIRFDCTCLYVIVW